MLELHAVLLGGAPPCLRHQHDRVGAARSIRVLDEVGVPGRDLCAAVAMTFEAARLEHAPGGELVAFATWACLGFGAFAACFGLGIRAPATPGGELPSLCLALAPWPCFGTLAPPCRFFPPVPGTVTGTVPGTMCCAAGAGSAGAAGAERTGAR